MAVDYPSGRIASPLPQRVDTETGASLWAVAIMLGTIIGSFFALRGAIKRLFVLDWRRPEPWPEAGIPQDLDLSDLPFGRYAVLLGAPRSGKTEALKSWRGVKHINLAGDPLSWTKHKSDKVVVLDHFEHLLNNSAQWQREVLERLIYEAESVIIVTTVDPKYYFDCLAKRKDSSDDESEGSLDIERWTKVLARFHVVRATNPSSVQGDEYFALLWRTCSDDERLALRQIAVYGWANYRQKPAMTHLFQRGLLMHGRKFKVTDPSQPGGVGAEAGEAESRFARYLQRSFKARRLVIPEEHGTADLGVLRIVIFVVFGVLVASLAYVWGDQVVSYVVAGAGAVTPAIRAIARSKAPGSESANA
jgi:hypothetical protein